MGTRGRLGWGEKDEGCSGKARGRCGGSAPLYIVEGSPCLFSFFLNSSLVAGCELVPERENACVCACCILALGPDGLREGKRER